MSQDQEKSHINKHEYDNIKTETIKQEPELPKGIDISQLEFIGTKTVVKYSANTKVEVTRYEYLVNMYKDTKTGIIYSGKVPETPLRGSAFTSAFITLLICYAYICKYNPENVPQFKLRDIRQDAEWSYQQDSCKSVLQKSEQGAAIGDS